MRLFHVSEEGNISKFEPRIPTRGDLDRTMGLVGAIDEEHLPHFLTPRNCPRVAYHVGKDTTQMDVDRFFSSKTMHYAIVVESKWFEAIQAATLYLYEFAIDDFTLQDDVAGYYVAKTPQAPIAKYELHDLCPELMKRNVEIRIVDNLWHIAGQVKASTLRWSFCRMAFAQPECSS